MVSALAAHFTARGPHANTVQLPAGGQHQSSAATVRRTRYPARSTYPPRPALTPPLPTLPCGQRRAAPGHVISADHGRPVGTVDMWIARISASSAAPSRVRISMLARHPSCGPARTSLQFAECTHSANVRSSARHRRRADTPIVHGRPNLSRCRIDHKSTAPRAHPGVAHPHAWTTPRGERLRDPARSRPFVRRRGCMDNAHRST
ncbi:hypothetical protein KY49_6786 [Burkholderia sp. MSHR3999]|nr:hypothetical protein KY49_6786 [Burkholderia sp. MSHR3999]